jgi:membrane-anchored protein YejM (alkaline phosphatase superfamily)
VSDDIEVRLRTPSALVVAIGLSSALVRERLSDERHSAAAELAKRLPWAENEEVRAPRGEEDRSAVADIRAAERLGALRAHLASATLSVRERPDLLIVHVESLRGDVLTPALMPRLSGLGSECWTARRHYSTGNNTGMSVFGLVTGLGGFFYAGARREPGSALPLVVLQKLGYRNAVHFANNLSHYDNIFNVAFGSAVPEPYTAPEGPSDRMDVAVVEHYLSSLDSQPSPRFDYLVLDSTHYDYAYPPEYERHTPSGTLGLSVRDALIEEPGINERLSPRGPIIKNRYLNAVEWVDSLIGRIVEGLRAHGKWGKTWVAIVGDHGEAFWEHGTFGHGAGLEDEQVRVPFVLCGPHRPSARYEYSSHADLMPTWLDAMGLEGSAEPFMSGRSLLVYRPETDVAVAGLGITGTALFRRFVAAGHGLKVTFDNSATFPIIAVNDADDRPLTTAGFEAATVLSMALGTKLFRAPAGN